MTKSCKNCNQNFELSDKELSFFEKITTPVPDYCPKCRKQRRFSFRNERNLYLRKCDLSGKQIVTVYSPDKPFKVYSHEDWWSDTWDARNYSQVFDFNKPFFAQYKDLQSKVPRMSMILTSCENSDYAPYSVNSKNCYMCVSVINSEDIYYSYQTNFSRDCMDCLLCYHSELCYESVYGLSLYHCFWTVSCRDSQDLFFCRDCQNCQNCICCFNLKNKSFHIYNKPVAEAEYNEFLAKFNSNKFTQEFQGKFQQYSLKFPYRENYNINCENCTGDHLQNSSNSDYCFDGENLEDCKYVYVSPKGAKDCQDIHYSPLAELVYDSMSAVNCYDCKFALHSWDNKHCTYVDECYFSGNLFGCIGLKRAKFCIFNKQYTEEEYTSLLPKIIEHLKKTAEYGQFFPIELSPYAYNETLAQEHFPLTKSEALSKNYKWKDTDRKEYKPGTYTLTDTPDDLSDQITTKILACGNCSKNYKIIVRELNFYRKNKLPIPSTCPDCRYTKRASHRNPFELWPNKCYKCQKEIRTTYAPGRPEKVYCEKCYFGAIY